MNADFSFKTGTGKVICQDYAVAGVHGGLGYAIGSDGCSSSPDTDVGARLMCLTARSVCVPLWDKEHKSEAFHKIAEHMITDRCHSFWRQLNVPVDMFDATLWVALWDPRGYAYVMGWGDGVVIADYGSKRCVIKHEYPHNAPLYMSYNLDSRRREEHHKQFGAQKSVITEWKTAPSDCGEITLQTELDWGYIFVRSFCTEGLVSLSVCSDGINTFINDKNEPIAFWKMAEEYVAYKSLTGEFVKRRMGRVARKHHYDDVFCATIVEGKQ